MKGFSPRELDDWYCSFFDLEHRELGLILESTSLEGKRVAEIGCGTGRVSFQLIPFARKYVGIDWDEKLIAYCNEKLAKAGKKAREKARFVVLPGEEIDSLGEGFDVIISTWAGMHYSRARKKLVKAIGKSLYPGGMFLLIEADQRSEFVKALNRIAPLKPGKEGEWEKKFKELEEMLGKGFSVKKRVLDMYYKLPSLKELKNKFRYELEHEEETPFTKAMEEKLEKFFSGKANEKGEIILGDKALFLVCKKNLKT